MKKQYKQPTMLFENFDLDEQIALDIYDGSAPDIGEEGDGETFGFD